MSEPQRPEDLWSLERPDSESEIRRAEAFALEQARQAAHLAQERALAQERERLRAIEAASQAADVAARQRKDAQAAARRALAHEVGERGRPGAQDALALRYRLARQARAQARQERAQAAAARSAAPASLWQRLRGALRRAVGR